jgi:K+-transporting ATPase ATPase C chain
MRQQLRTAFILLLFLTALTGGAYPLFITVLGQIFFPSQANGSLIHIGDQVVGSALIGQANNDLRYFWNRPSAIGYDPLPSGGSNLGSTSELLRQQVVARERAFRDAHGLPNNVPVPVELLFASASGLDPHISPQAARLQIARVAAARKLPVERVAALVETYIEPPQLGFLGQPRLNVLLLNLALDSLE